MLTYKSIFSCFKNLISKFRSKLNALENICGCTKQLLKQTRGRWVSVRRRCNALKWRHNGRDGVSNHQPDDCLFNRLFRRRWKRTSKLRVTGLCVGNSPGTGEFPAQMASNSENVCIWWRHHGPKLRFNINTKKFVSCGFLVYWFDIVLTFSH